MKTRVLTALVLIPPAAYLLGWAPEWLFLLALVGITVAALQEYFSLSLQAGFPRERVVGFAAAAALCLAQAAELRSPSAFPAPLITTLILSLLVTLMVGLPLRSDPRAYLAASASTVFGVVYLGFSLSWLIPIRFSPSVAGQGLNGRGLVLFLFTVIYVGDACALIVGRSLGRTPLVGRLSPKKTVEGALAGLAGSLLVGLCFERWIWRTAGLKTVMLLALPVAIAGQIGDLVESALKRAAGVKDSSALLPGHGGLLDRIDSVIFGAPVLWLVLTLQNYWKGK